MISDGYPHVNTHKNVSYPQLYPQINLTDYIFRHSRSGVKWSIVENRAFIRGAS